jgi:nucleoside-diphosphate-sugar epimerase
MAKIHARHPKNDEPREEGERMTVVVTGANGHVGANLVRLLLQRGQRVRALIHRNENALQGLDIERVRGDVLEPASLRAAFDGAEIVFHLASVISICGDRDGVVATTNVRGAANVAEAARECRVRRLVHTSSVHAFMQEPLAEPLDERRRKVDTPRYPAYDRSKAAGEAEVRKVIAQGLDAVIVNPTGVIGPYDYAPSRMGRMFLNFYRRQVAALVPGGFNWVDVRDLVTSIIAASERGRTGENYLLPGHWQSVAALASITEKITGVPSPRFTCPMGLARLGARVMDVYGWVTGGEPLFTAESLHALRANRRVIGDKAARELGHQARPTQETVRAVYEWFAQAGLMAAADQPRSSHPTQRVQPER